MLQTLSRTLAGLVLLGQLAGCQTINSGSNSELPKITRDMKLDEAYRYAVEYGADILTQTRDLARDRQQLPELSKLAEQDLLQKADSLPAGALLNIAHLYRVSSATLSPQVLLTMTSAKSLASRQIAWRLAASKPSPDIARTIETILSQALEKGHESDILLTEMAGAIQENSIKSAYSFLILGLMQQGAPEFANAMLALDPSKAASPFVDYLNRADLDDLRQLNQKSVNLLTCTVIFRFFSDNSLPLNHPGIGQIFQFAVSRNRALAEMAFAVLEKSLPENRLALAALLARQPVQVQVAFIENSQRDLTSNLRLFLTDMKDVVQSKEVMEELNSQQGATEQ
ncbi:MAG: hypothetical protein NTX25_11500 [Proteobacteria bacterium]|nr:hypothetical protein [Pseudomonadota bacterium]